MSFQSTRSEGYCSQPSPYAVLGITQQTVTATKLRQAYKSKLLQVHPDKPNGSRQAFEIVQNAYAALTNHESVSANQPPAVVVDTLPLCEMEVEDGMATSPCRCGDVFSVPLSSVVAPHLLVVCQGCSLAIQVRKN